MFEFIVLILFLYLPVLIVPGAFCALKYPPHVEGIYRAPYYKAYFFVVVTDLAALLILWLSVIFERPSSMYNFGLLLLWIANFVAFLFILLGNQRKNLNL